MPFPYPFLALPIGPRSDFFSSESSSSSSLFAGDSRSSNPTDNTPPRSPTNEEPRPIKPISLTAACTPCGISLLQLQLPYKTNENEQVSRLDGESPPKTPIQRASPLSPLLRIQLQEDDIGYESGSEDEGSPCSPTKRFGRVGRNLFTPARLRSVTAPVFPKVGENTSSPSGVEPTLPAILRPNRPSKIDLAAISPYAIKPRAGKTPIGLGLGLPSNHPLQTPRASTAPMPMSPPISHAPIANLLPCRPFSPLSPRTRKIQDPRLRPTIMAGSPSPIEMLPSRFSYFQRHDCPSPLQGSQLPYPSPRDAILEPSRLHPTVISGMPSPMELYSSFAYDVAYPRTPFASPEADASPSFSLVKETPLGDRYNYPSVG